MFPFHLQHRIAYLNVYSEISFSSSVDHWRDKSKGRLKNWHTFKRPIGPIRIDERDGLEVEGDCNHPVLAEKGGTVHIDGDLRSNLVVGGHHEVVIHGDVTEEATIMASGFHHLFVSGSMKGQHRSTDGAMIWVEKNFLGSLETGSPSTSLHIGQDLRGSIAPYTEAALLWMTVKGFASQESLRSISASDYTVFEASVARSDIQPGFYPQENANRRTKHGYCSSNWSVGKKE